jgi:hypothetical protein
MTALKNVYFFNVLTYDDDFSFILKSKKEVKVIRTNFESAYNYVKTKYPISKGYFIELQNNCSLYTYKNHRKAWFEYLAK